MSRSFLVFVILSLFDRCKMECAAPNLVKTRVFDSLVRYQGNKLPFSPLEGGWEGSKVEFNATLKKIEKNSFVTFDSEAIIELKLSHTGVKEVDEGAFISLLCLHDLFLDHNNITQLNNVFKNLERLQKLDLSHNQLTTIKDLTFSNLARLKVLNLGFNRIKEIEILAFTNLTGLEFLNLEHNSLKKIEKVFDQVPNLTSLILAFNDFGEVVLDKWGNLTNLQNLDLAGNNLRSFYPPYVTLSVKMLNLSHNFLTVLDVRGIRRHLPNLEMIDLNDNPWFCNDLETIVHELNDSRIKFSSSATSGGVKGITCSEVSRFSTTSTSTSTVSSTSTSAPSVWVNKTELERYVEKKIRDNNAGLRERVDSIRTFVIFVFALLCVFIILEVVFKSKILVGVVRRCRGGGDYVDDSENVENFRLLHGR